MDCQKHNAPMEVEEVHFIQDDKDGNPEERSEEMWICRFCDLEAEEKKEEEKLNYLVDQYYLSSDPELGEEIDKRLSDPDKKNMLTTSYSIIDHYAPLLSEAAQCQLEVAEAVVKFLISSQLHHLKVESGIDKIIPNLAFLWIAPTAVGKDPLINNGIKDFTDILIDENGYRLYNEVTGPAFVRSVSQIVSKSKDKNVRIRTLNIWNEFSSFAKLSGAKGTNTGIETLNQAIDGYVQGRASVSRPEDLGSNVYAMVFAAGTPTFLRYVGDDFWDLGGASRFDILPYSPGELHDIAPSRDANAEFKEDLKLELGNIQKRVKAVKWDPEMWIAYNRYRNDILTEVRKFQMSIQDAMAEENYPVISKGKFPLKVLKHAVIHAVARHNYTESGVVCVEVEDFRKAVVDVEKHHSYLVDLYKAWREMDWRNAADASAKNVLRLIGTIKKRYSVTKEKYTTKKIDKRTGREEQAYRYIAEVNPKGEYVDHSTLLTLSHLKAEGYGSLDEAITTLSQRNVIAKRGGGDTTPMFFREPKKKDRPMASILYKLTSK